MLTISTILQRTYKLALVGVCASALSACTMGQIDKLKHVGEAPPMEDSTNPMDKEGYHKISWPSPPPEPPVKRTANSLFQGSRTFFRDQRARKEGDILTVKVAIDDQAKLDNKTERKRDASEDVGFPKVFGLQKKLNDALPREVQNQALLGIDSKTNSKGEGKIERKEKIETEVAAVVTQVLPNGNLAISGSQEVRVNFEIRELTVKGVIRPEDISPLNTVELAQLAEARVSYGGRGHVTDIQAPRAGQQIIDILSPF
ncbi:MAG: flagellar basal body L-ring protein FlgH [Proteobacteria bacterium]|nr:flagellar basal body L-ring protein FlgH [Pseudomonadota bacterium]